MDVGLCVHRYPHGHTVSSGVCSHFVPGHFGPGHFSPWARLVCIILAGSCRGVSRERRVMVRFRVKVRVRD